MEFIQEEKTLLSLLPCSHNLKEKDSEYKAFFTTVQAIPLRSDLPLLSSYSPPFCCIFHLIFCSYLKILVSPLIFSLLREIFITHFMYWNLHIPNEQKGLLHLFHTTKACRSIARYIKHNGDLSSEERCNGVSSS